MENEAARTLASSVHPARTNAFHHETAMRSKCLSDARVTTHEPQKALETAELRRLASGFEPTLSSRRAVRPVVQRRTHQSIDHNSILFLYANLPPDCNRSHLLF